MVTWAGFDRRIIGHSRYRIVGSEGLDEFHLEIVNSTLYDEAEYQCQVAPAAGDRHLVGIAYLTVTGTFAYIYISLSQQLIN